jgi:hypothetical protein
VQPASVLPDAVAGVSRSGTAPANAIFRRLRDSGHEGWSAAAR